MTAEELACALEAEVAAIRGLEESPGRTGAGCAACSLRIDRHFRRILALMRPRIARLTRRYGLCALREDAEQACSIGLHRAIQAWDPARAGFATLAHWQMRGELQGLRHRVMLDQRRSARTARVRTVSLLANGRQERAEVLALADEAALVATERGASDRLAYDMLARLLDRIDAPPAERALAHVSLFAPAPLAAPDRRTREQQRQIVRRTLRNCAKLVAA